MKKLFVLVFIGLNLYAQAAQARYPDLSDWVPGKTLLGRASTLILHISVHKKFQLNGKTYFVDFADNEHTIDHSLLDISDIKKALEDETLNLDREENTYTLSNFRGHRITFEIRRDESIGELPDCINRDDKNIQFFDLLNLGSAAEKTLAYKVYLNGQCVDSKFIDIIFCDIKNFGVWNKIDIYEVCLGCTAMTEEQVERVLKEAEKLENDCYKVPIYAAYMQRDYAKPKVMAQMLADAKSFESRWNTSFVYAAYLKRKVIDFAEFTSIIVDAASNFDQASRTQVYVAYFGREDADADTAFMMLKEAETDFIEEHKAEIYSAYIQRKDVRFWDIIRLLLESQSFKGVGNIASVYEAYLSLADAHPEIITIILEDAESFVEGFKAPVYAAYVGREDADLELIALILIAAQNFEDGWYTNLIYQAYMQRQNPHPKVIEHYGMEEQGIQL